MPPALGTMWPTCRLAVCARTREHRDDHNSEAGLCLDRLTNGVAAGSQPAVGKTYGYRFLPEKAGRAGSYTRGITVCQQRLARVLEGAACVARLDLGARAAACRVVTALVSGRVPLAVTC